MEAQDLYWPRRKKSELVVRRIPEYLLIREQKAAEPAEVPIHVPIKRPAEMKPSGVPEMWPRRRKSDLLIYQQTRNL